MFNNMTDIREALAHYRWFHDTVDIALVYYLFYRMLLLIKGTRAFQMLIGIGLIVLVLVASQTFEFYTLDWLIRSFWSQIMLALVIIFQPEIRRTLARVGERHLFRQLSIVESSKFIEETVKAAVNMANKRIGGLIVLDYALSYPADARGVVALSPPLGELRLLRQARRSHALQRI